MKILRAVAVVSALLVPSTVGADTISFFVKEGITNEMSAAFGLVPFEVSDGTLRERFGSFGNRPVILSGGSVELVSGALLDQDVDAVNGRTTYSYGAGLLQLTMRVNGCCGGMPDVVGTFVAETLPFSIVVCEGCDLLFGGGTARDFDIPFGAGLFSADLASFLHIDPHTLGGFIDFGLEDIDGDPLSNRRIGFDHRGHAVLEIEVQDVPEPASALLLLAAAAATCARRGISRVRTSASR
jgi:hypothetical protein